MRTIVYPAGPRSDACSYYRIVAPAEVLGVTIEFESKVACQFVDDPIPRVVDVAPIPADVVVFQRPLRRHMFEMIGHIQAQGVAVVVEIDDDFHSIARNNQVWPAVNPAQNPDRNWEWLNRSCQIADLVTVTTPALARRYASHGRVEILPNYVPERYLSVPKVPNERLTVGWPGVVGTHPTDLGQMGHIAPLFRDVAFRAIGSEQTLDVLGIPEGQREHVPYVKLHEGFAEAVASLDIGVAPLDSTAFNRAKSWLKALEYAALGVPYVASPHPGYDALRKLGGGLIAANARGWKRELSRLIASEDYRAEVAGRGGEAAKHLTYEQHADKWLNAWTVARGNAARRATLRVA